MNYIPTHIIECQKCWTLYNSRSVPGCPNCLRPSNRQLAKKQFKRTTNKKWVEKEKKHKEIQDFRSSIITAHKKALPPQLGGFGRKDDELSGLR